MINNQVRISYFLENKKIQLDTEIIKRGLEEYKRLII